MKFNGWPTCAKCGCPVKEVVSGSNARARGFDLAVRCHGDEETIFISDEELMDADSVTLTVAFKDGNGPLVHPGAR